MAKRETKYELHQRLVAEKAELESKHADEMNKVSTELECLKGNLKALIKPVVEQILEEKFGDCDNPLDEDRVNDLIADALDNCSVDFNH